ncbi:Hypothetical protein NocV09_01101850 [Nannochloropsis oceanica]
MPPVHRGAPPRRPPHPQPPGQVQSQNPTKWYTLACTIAFELRPFTPPTRRDLHSFVHSTRQTLSLIYAETNHFIRFVSPLVRRVGRNLTSWRYLLPLTAFSSAFYLAVRAEFGVVFLIIAALSLILTVGLGDDASLEGEGKISPWSVFNRGMATMMGAINPEQFEAEIRNYQLVGEGALGGMVGGERMEMEEEEEEEEDEGREEERGGGGGGGRGPSRKSGKKARRKFDRDRRRERMLLAAGGGGEEWEEDWVSDEGEG